MKKVVVIGGGTGTFTVLSGIKEEPYEISVIVSMMDSGGSTGRLRDQFGVLPPGDIRQCLVALSDAPDLWRKLFLYRFENGDFRGHNFGNIFLAALEKTTSDYQELIDTASHKKSRISKAYLKPRAKANPRALQAIHKADYIIIGPGDLYTSLIPNLLVDGVQKALDKSEAKIINFMNLMTKSGQTTHYTASEHINDLKKYIGRNIDCIFVNTGRIRDDILDHYRKYNEDIVEDDLEMNSNIIRIDLVANVRYNASKADRHPRSILRHDSEKVLNALKKILT